MLAKGVTRGQAGPWRSLEETEPTLLLLLLLLAAVALAVLAAAVLAALAARTTLLLLLLTGLLGLAALAALLATTRMLGHLIPNAPKICAEPEHRRKFDRTDLAHHAG
jgi:hypothetical protein